MIEYAKQLLLQSGIPRVVVLSGYWCDVKRRALDDIANDPQIVAKYALIRYMCIDVHDVVEHASLARAAAKENKPVLFVVQEASANFIDGFVKMALRYDYQMVCMSIEDIEERSQVTNVGPDNVWNLAKRAVDCRMKLQEVIVANEALEKDLRPVKNEVVALRGNIRLLVREKQKMCDDYQQEVDRREAEVRQLRTELTELGDVKTALLKESESTQNMLNHAKRDLIQAKIEMDKLRGSNDELITVNNKLRAQWTEERDQVKAESTDASPEKLEARRVEYQKILEDEISQRTPLIEDLGKAKRAAAVWLRRAKIAESALKTSKQDSISYRVIAEKYRKLHSSAREANKRMRQTESED